MDTPSFVAADIIPYDESDEELVVLIDEEDNPWYKASAVCSLLDTTRRASDLVRGYPDSYTQKVHIIDAANDLLDRYTGAQGNPANSLGIYTPIASTVVQKTIQAARVLSSRAGYPYQHYLSFTGLLRAVNRGRSDEAVAFQEWLSHVIQMIARYGCYVASDEEQEVLQNTLDPSGLARSMEQENMLSSGDGQSETLPDVAPSTNGTSRELVTTIESQQTLTRELTDQVTQTQMMISDKLSARQDMLAQMLQQQSEIMREHKEAIASQNRALRHLLGGTSAESDQTRTAAQTATQTRREPTNEEILNWIAPVRYESDRKQFNYYISILAAKEGYHRQTMYRRIYRMANEQVRGFNHAAFRDNYESIIAGAEANPSVMSQLINLIEDHICDRARTHWNL
jgi:prophage antirepressor-like protein